MGKRGFLALPLIPLQKLFKPKKATVTFEFLFYPSFCYIKETLAENENRNDGLITAYICYVARYFHICDDRQREPMMGAFASLYRLDEVDYTDFIGFVEGQVFQTLNKQEKKAKIGLFTAMSPPPYMLISEDRNDSKRLGKYSFAVKVEENNMVTSHLELSFGMDMILLPHSLALFHKYVMENLTDEHSKKLVNQMSLEVLSAIGEGTPSSKWEIETINKVLAAS